MLKQYKNIKKKFNKKIQFFLKTIISATKSKMHPIKCSYHHLLSIYSHLISSLHNDS